MEVEFVLRPDDVMALYEYAWDNPAKGAGRGARMLRWALLIILGLLSGFSVLALVLGHYSFSVFFLPTMFILYLLLVLFRRPLLRRAARRNLAHKVNKNAKLLGWQRFVLTPESLTAASEQSTTTLAWTAIEKIIIGERAMIFDSPSSAYVIPRRAFADEEAFREFVATARRYRDAAKDDRAPLGVPRRKRSGEDDTGIKRASAPTADVRPERSPESRG